jgi:hypothetical protein
MPVSRKSPSLYLVQRALSPILMFELLQVLRGVSEVGQQLQYMHNLVLLEEAGCADANPRASAR